MNRRQKTASLPRWLINIGLTLQFYIPGALYLFIVCVGIYGFVTAPPGKGVPGLAVVIVILILFILIVTTTWFVIYMLWNRYGNRSNALGFLIATNLFGGGIWLLLWIKCFWPGLLNDPDLWLFSPAPIFIPTLLYFIAWLKMCPKKEND